MCGSNNGARVCRTHINHLAQDGSRISFGPFCNRAMWQHVIRHQLTPRGCDNPPNWDALARAMHLIRDDGQPWSPTWDRLVIPRVLSSLERKAREAVSKGLVEETLEGEREWYPWARGFLSPDWDGVDFSESGANRLLQSTKSTRDEDEIAALQAQLQQLGHTPVVPPRLWTIKEETESDVVDVCDSISQAGRQPDGPRVQVQLQSRSPPMTPRLADPQYWDQVPLQEVINLLLDTAAELADLAVNITTLKEEMRPGDSNNHDIAAALHLLREERERQMDRALFLDDIVHERLEGRNGVPFHLAGRIWIHFLMGTEHSPVLEARLEAAELLPLSSSSDGTSCCF
ncbi:hypothetical protein QBC47DRAFT_407846 [Echria macrotheca]|uniref:Uncharacterized protein n=1 Tax=Echria macrotheca TaxID=438768 RepID=A0AAJ0F018_9PEZI|nr:hypothetical protein QBC47DRAFT_407846 [Echria macrotheca]